MYKPNLPYNVPLKLLIPSWKTINGVRKKTYPAVDDVSDDLIILASFRTFGGTETTINGVYSIEKTAVVETNYRPDITSDCQIYVIDTKETYEIIGDPENIEMRNRTTKFKVKKISGKA